MEENDNFLDKILEEDLSIEKSSKNATDKINSQAIANPVYRVKISYSSETYFAQYFAKDVKETKTNEHENPPTALKNNTYVILPTKFGKDMGYIQGIVKNVSNIETDSLVKIIRLASEDDKKNVEQQKEKEVFAFEFCKKRIEARKMSMKLIFAHYLFEEQKLLFVYSSDTRVDFRDLVKDLVAKFKTRIDLRQIGIRDEARVLGGCGVCGRQVCCHSVTDKLAPVSIKMAKEQNLSLNSMKLSGPCGRLLCCLSFEHECYLECRKNLPHEGVSIFYKQEECLVEELNPISSKINVRASGGRFLQIPFEMVENVNGRWQTNSQFDHIDT